MSLRIKTLLMIGLIFFGATLFLTYSFKKILLEPFIELEENDAVVDLKRSVNFIKSTVRNLDATNSDWAGWDDTYDFAEDKNPEYIRSNLVDGTFANLRLNLMAFFDNSGKMFWGTGYDLVKDKKALIPEDLQAFFSGLVKHREPKSSKKGLIMLNGGPMILSSRPIVTSNDQGPIRGALIIGRYLNEKEILRMSQSLQLDISTVASGKSKRSEGVAPEIFEGLDFFVRPSGQESLDAYTLIRDMEGRPGLILKIKKARTLFLNGKKALGKIALRLEAFAFVFIILLLFLLDKTILSRLSDLNDGINNIVKTNDISKRLAVKGGDELSHLAKAVNDMLASIASAQASIRKSEEKYRRLFETSPEVIFTLSVPEKNITSLNPAFEAVTKWAVDDWIGKPFSGIISPEDQPTVLKYFDQVINGMTTPPFEIRVKDKNDIYLTGEFMAAAETVEGKIVGVVGFARDITERKKMEHKLNRTAGKLRHLSGQLLNLQEKEREKISRELHDQLGQDITLLKFGIRNIMKQMPAKDSELTRNFEEVMQSIDGVLENIRRMSRDLSPSMLSDLGLAAALEKLIENFAALGNYQCHSLIENIDPFIPRDKHIMVYRIVQELLTNIAKHAKATEITINAFVEEDAVKVTIRDNGKGYDTASIFGESDCKGGLGLSFIRERVHILGGAIFVDSNMDQGTATMIVIPALREREA